jgi:hypothetical protein
MASSFKGSDPAYTARLHLGRTLDQQHINIATLLSTAAQMKIVGAARPLNSNIAWQKAFVPHTQDGISRVKEGVKALHQTVVTSVRPAHITRTGLRRKSAPRPFQFVLDGVSRLTASPSWPLPLWLMPGAILIAFSPWFHALVIAM